MCIWFSSVFPNLPMTSGIVYTLTVVDTHPFSLPPSIPLHANKHSAPISISFRLSASLYVFQALVAHGDHFRFNFCFTLHKFSYDSETHTSRIVFFFSFILIFFPRLILYQITMIRYTQPTLYQIAQLDYNNIHPVAGKISTYTLPYT